MFTMELQHNACEIEHEVTTLTYNQQVNRRPEAKFLNSNKAQKCIGQRAVKKSRPNKTIKLQHEDSLLGM